VFELRRLGVGERVRGVGRRPAEQVGRERQPVGVFGVGLGRVAAPSGVASIAAVDVREGRAQNGVSDASQAPLGVFAHQPVRPHLPFTLEHTNCQLGSP